MDKTYSEKYRKLGQNIAYYRKDRGYTQKSAAVFLFNSSVYLCSAV